MDEGRLMELDTPSLTTLATQIADLRAKAEAHARALSHLHAELRLLEEEMLRMQEVPDDWE